MKDLETYMKFQFENKVEMLLEQCIKLKFPNISKVVVSVKDGQGEISFIGEPSIKSEVEEFIKSFMNTKPILG